jgi:hypothetical protein
MKMGHPSPQNDGQTTLLYTYHVKAEIVVPMRRNSVRNEVVQ